MPLTQQEIENRMIEEKLCMDFKKFLLANDANSRYHILNKCKELCQAEYSRTNEELINESFRWFQDAQHTSQNNQNNKSNFDHAYNWEILYKNLSKCLYFQKVIGLYLTGIPPSGDIR